MVPGVGIYIWDDDVIIGYGWIRIVVIDWRYCW